MYVCTYIVHTNVAMCVYLCTYIVHMNVAMYVCNPSDMLQAQPDSIKVFKHPHEYYCQVQSGTKNTVILQGRIQDFYNGVSISKKLQEYIQN